MKKKNRYYTFGGKRTVSTNQASVIIATSFASASLFVLAIAISKKIAE